MERFVKGDIVAVLFPFSDLSRKEKRPALVLADIGMDDYILCQITTVHNRDDDAMAIRDADYSGQSLHKPSNVRPNKLFTASRGVITGKISRLQEGASARVVDKIIEILKR